MDGTTASAYFTGPQSQCWRPNGTLFHELLEADELPARAIKRAYAYRALEWQHPPPPPDPNIPM